MAKLQMSNAGQKGSHGTRWARGSRRLERGVGFGPVDTGRVRTVAGGHGTRWARGLRRLKVRGRGFSAHSFRSPCSQVFRDSRSCPSVGLRHFA